MSDVVGCILAGGRARRMGGVDKGLVTLRNRPLLEYVVERLNPQVSGLLVNANGNPARLASFGLPIVGDAVEGHPGPLAGMLTGLEWMETHVPHAEWLATAATDTPFLPPDFVGRLLEAAQNGDYQGAYAASGGRAHPVCGIWHVGLAAKLRQALVGEGIRAVRDWTARCRLAVVEFGVSPYDPFFNVNRPEDLVAAEAIVREHFPWNAE